MIKLLEIPIYILLGAALGFIYFGGLWLTVRKFLLNKRLAVLVLLSFFIRNGFLLFALYLIGRGGEWIKLILVLIGVIGIRWMLFRKLNREKLNHNCLERG